MDESLTTYIEEVALYWEAQGLPRIAGRIVGLLLVCDPPHRSAGQIVEELGVSKASVSTMTRLLLEAHTIEVATVPGKRATYYRLTPDSLERKFTRRIEKFASFGDLAQRGLELMGGDEDRATRLRRVASMYAFLERELPLLLQRWRDEMGDA